ncbi:class I SAM-dependent methyltransferase [Actinoplanes philippinensis]|uniref:class I SAM-dependent methyltransferase n=1 Tax=Actinoplanes philippinensis TaxID=35752 RepID=UPI0033D0A63A
MRVFGTAADAYARHRPGYAADAVRWAIETAPGSRVLDLGAGTGKLTGALLDAGAAVTAVEPDPAMLAALRDRFPRVAALAGSAETIPAADASADAVVAGNALHWFDMAVAGPQIRRVLAPGGVLAGLWNTLDDRVGWVADLAAVAGPEVVGPRDTPAAWRAATAGLLGPGVERAAFAHGQVRTADSLVQTLATRAGVLVMPAAQRGERLERIGEFLAGRPETADGEFVLPMVTCGLRARWA